MHPACRHARQPIHTFQHCNSLPVQRCKGISMLYNNAGCTTTLNRRLCVVYVSITKLFHQVMSFRYIIRDYGII